MTHTQTHKSKEGKVATPLRNGGTLTKSVSTLNNLQNITNDSPQVSQLKVLQKYAQKTEALTQFKGASSSNGLPAQLKSGVENLSGVNMDDVNVNYGSSQPSQMGAAAFAKGSEIHVGPGQEKHLPHEAWHVVQQKKGRVQPTAVVDSMPINDNPSLEKEADVMGAKAASLGNVEPIQQMSLTRGVSTSQEPMQFFFGNIFNKKSKTDPGATNNTPQSATPSANTIANPGEEKSLVKSHKERASKITTTEKMGALFSKGLSFVKNKFFSKDKAENLSNGSEVADGLNSGISGINEQTKKQIDPDHPKAAGIIESTKSFAEFIKSGTELWEKRDIHSGAKTLANGASLANNIMVSLSEFGIINVIPGFGSAVGAFKNAMDLYKDGKARDFINKFNEDKQSVLSFEEKEAISKFISISNISLTNNSIDFAVNLVSVVGDFFPPVKAAMTTVKLAKSLFIKGLEAWQGYREYAKKIESTKRIFGDSESLNEEDKKSIDNLSKKINHLTTPTLKNGGSLQDLVMKKIKCESLEDELENAKPEPEEERTKKAQIDLLKTQLNTDLKEYNDALTAANLTEYSINENEIKNLAEIHRNVIQSITLEVKNQYKFFNYISQWLTKEKISNKNAIINQIYGNEIPDLTDLDKIKEAEHLNFFWNETRSALFKLSSANSLSTEEIMEKLKNILKSQGIEEEKINELI